MYMCMYSVLVYLSPEQIPMHTSLASTRLNPECEAMLRNFM